nr:hypothetical protein [Tanacetum cinerariifolium]
MADDQPMWGNNQAVEPTLRAAIVTVDLGDNFTVKVVEVLTHLQSVTTSLWEVPKMKKPTMPTKLIEDEDIEETTTVGVLEIGETINQEMKTRTRNLEKTHLSFHQHLKRCSTNSTLKKPYSGLTHDPPVNPNAKTTVIYDDSDDEAYKPKILYPQCLRKEKMEEHYANFIDLIKEVRINIPLIDVLAGMPNYKKFLRDLVSNKRSDEYLTLVDLGASIKLMPYTLCALLSGSTLKPTRMSIRIHGNQIEEIPEQEEEAENIFKVLPLEGNQRIKNSIQEPSTDLVLKTLHGHLEYAFLEKDFLLPVVISSLLKTVRRTSCFYSQETQRSVCLENIRYSGH